MSPYSTLLLALILLCSTCNSSLADKCDKDDKKALLAIKAHFNNAGHFVSWTPNTGACCDWIGVNCGPSDSPSTSSRVVGIGILVDSSLTGTLPPQLGDLPFLTEIVFHHLPNLTGTIPQTITQLKSLSLIDLSFNGLSGPVPDFLSQIPSLTDLDLSFNKFSGSIPPSLAKLPNLGALHLDRNQLTGPIPDSFGSFPKTSPPDLYLSHNSLSGAIPTSLGVPEWGTIDLSRNMLTGDASFLFGAAKPTTQLDISRNQLAFDLTGVTFPVNTTLLDLNHNMIFGSIPPQINQVAGLALFNVSYNRLCGQIPAGAVTAQFDQFEYFHNKCLCGSPLSPCS